MTTKKLISLPDDLARDIKAAAAAAGQSDSFWIREAAEARLAGTRKESLADIASFISNRDREALNRLAQ
ncbi:ribbon-helix-helix protein, CopG family [Pseudactinotalea sp.]|uniref:ribbon-helix-helix protein, CopG family n=1 Tax=Pseudactinotalea sp. TaxID=1926260 RepID=UPI003B3A9BF5